MRPRHARAGAVAHRHAAHAEEGFLVALAKGLQHLERVDRRHVELAQANQRGDLASGLELLGGQPGQHPLQARAEGVDHIGGDCHAHGPLVPAEADCEVGALLDRVEEVHGPDGAAAAARLPVLRDGEDDRGHMVLVHETAGDDALDALVPAAAGDDHGTLAVPGALGLGDGRVGELALDGAAVGVDLLEAAREHGRLGHVVGQQQAEGDVGLAHATRRVEAGHEREGQVVGRDGREVAARRRGQGHDAGARGGAHAGDAVGHERAVLALQEHHVGHGAQAGQVGQGEPQVGHAQARAQLAHDLERHAHAGQLARGAGGVELGVAHGHAPGHQVGGLVVVGDHHVDAAREQGLDLAGCGDAVVDRHDQLRVAGLHHAVEPRLGEAVALREAVGHKGVHVRAQLGQADGEQAGGGHAVHVEVAEDRDRLAQADGALQAVGRLAQARDAQGVAPVALERRGQEGARRRSVGDAAGHEHARHQRRHAKLRHQAPLSRHVTCQYLPAPTVGKPRHGYSAPSAVLSPTGVAVVAPYFFSIFAHFGSRVFHIARSGEATAKLE